MLHLDLEGIGKALDTKKSLSLDITKVDDREFSLMRLESYLFMVDHVLHECSDYDIGQQDLLKEIINDCFEYSCEVSHASNTNIKMEIPYLTERLRYSVSLKNSLTSE